MSTVPKADTPPPANNAKTLLVSDAMSGNYGRPASGGPPQAGNPAGTPGPTAPAANVPGYAINWAGNPPSTGGYQVGEDIGPGATVLGGQPDATGHPVGDTSGGGTVGDSGNQGAGPGPTPMKPSGLPDIDNDGDSV